MADVRVIEIAHQSRHRLVLACRAQAEPGPGEAEKQRHCDDDDEPSRDIDDAVDRDRYASDHEGRREGEGRRKGVGLMAPDQAGDAVEHDI